MAKQSSSWAVVVRYTHGLLFIIQLHIIITACIGSTGADAAAAAATDSEVVHRILVPRKLGFSEFVAWDNDSFSGFAVDVFQRCVETLPFKYSFQFQAFGDGINEPVYNEMVTLLANKIVDGVVADLTITKERLELVDFTQPYVQSDLVMMVPVIYSSTGKSSWSFLRPFSTNLWLTIAAVFISTVIVLSILEHGHHHHDLNETHCDGNHNNNHNNNIHPKKHSLKQRLGDALWFTTMSLFFSQSDNLSTRLGRLVTVVWLIAVLVFTSSYTANLASILASQQTNPTIERFSDLQNSSLPMGYQDGSFVLEYLNTTLDIRPSRLVKLVNEEDYDRALSSGNVAAIIEEKPYIQSFLNSKCQYTIGGAEIAYFGGFGFAFPKDSNITKNISLAIISLAQSGDLQRIKNKWIGSGQCVTSSNTQDIKTMSFSGLFIIIGVLYGVCVFLRIIGWILVAYNPNIAQVTPIDIKIIELIRTVNDNPNT